MDDQLTYYKKRLLKSLPYSKIRTGFHNMARRTCNRMGRWLK